MVQNSLFNWDSVKLRINCIEALILLSLYSKGRGRDYAASLGYEGKPVEPMLNEEQVFCLRRIVHTTSKDDKATEDIEFSKRELKDIEEAIPLYGTADPTKYPPLQIKISNALLSMETIFIEDIEPITEVNYGNDSSDNTDQDSYCIPNSETRTGTIEEIRPRYDLPQPERTGG